MSSKQASNEPHRALSGPPGRRGPELKKNHVIRDSFPQLSGEQLFFRSDPRVVAKVDLLGVWPVLGHGNLEKLRTRAKNRKTQFPGARGTFGEKNRAPKSFSRKLRNFFTFCVLTDRTPRGGKSQNTVFLGPFGLGQSLGTSRNSGPKTEKHNFPELEALLGKNPSAPKVYARNCTTFLHFVFWPSGPPRPGNCEILFFLAFWPRAAPWHLEKFWAKNRKTQFPRARGTFGGNIRPP